MADTDTLAGTATAEEAEETIKKLPVPKELRELADDQGYIDALIRGFVETHSPEAKITPHRFHQLMNSVRDLMEYDPRSVGQYITRRLVQPTEDRPTAFVAHNGSCSRKISLSEQGKSRWQEIAQKPVKDPAVSMPTDPLEAALAKCSSSLTAKEDKLAMLRDQREEIERCIRETEEEAERLRQQKELIAQAIALNE